MHALRSSVPSLMMRRSLHHSLISMRRASLSSSSRIPLPCSLITRRVTQLPRWPFAVRAHLIHNVSILSSTTSVSLSHASSPSSCSSSSSRHSRHRTARNIAWLLPTATSAIALLAWLLHSDESNSVLCEGASVTPLLVPIPLPSSTPNLPLLVDGLQLAGEDTEIAQWWRRILAFLIDNTIVSVAFQVAHSLLAGPNEVWLVPLLSFSFNASYEILTLRFNHGATFGKWLMKLRVVREDGQEMDWQTSSIYWLGKCLNLALGVDVIYGTFDTTDAKCLHNVLSGTVVTQPKRPNVLSAHVHREMIDQQAMKVTHEIAARS